MKNIIFIVIIFINSSLFAADDLFVMGERAYNSKANCAWCHGVFGDGKGHPRSPGIAANLRETVLDEELLTEVLNCGIPGKAMPFFNRKAYKDPAICWDTVFDDYEKEDMPKKGDKTLSDQKLKAVVHYILVNFKDRGKVTKAECEEKFGAGTKLCKKYD